MVTKNYLISRQTAVTEQTEHYIAEVGPTSDSNATDPLVEGAIDATSANKLSGSSE